MNETYPTSSTASNVSGSTGTTGANGIGPGTGNGQPGATRDAVSRLASTAHEAVDRVAAKASPAVEKLRASASAAAETMKAKADQFGAVEEQWIASARNYVRDHPLTAVTIGVLVGLIIGKAGGRRSRYED